MNFTDGQTYIIIKDVITVILTVYGMYLATRGLSTWKEQMSGSKEFDASYNLNYSLLKLRNAVKHVRNPGIWNTEFKRALEYAKKKYPERADDPELEKNSTKYVYEMRWDNIIDIYTEIESHQLAAEVLWGSDIIKKIKPLNDKITQLRIALEQYLSPDIRVMKPQEINDIIYNRGNALEDDSFGKEINNAISVTMDFIKEKLES
mgnify:CR=1 FL=1